VAQWTTPTEHDMAVEHQTKPRHPLGRMLDVLCRRQCAYVDA